MYVGTKEVRRGTVLNNKLKTGESTQESIKIHNYTAQEFKIPSLVIIKKYGAVI